MNEKHWSVDDAAFILAVDRGTMPLSFFSHTAHIRLVWIILVRYPDQEVDGKVSDLIFRFVKHHGKPEQFNARLTHKAIMIIKKYKERTVAKDCRDLLLHHPELITNFRTLVEEFKELR